MFSVKLFPGQLFLCRRKLGGWSKDRENLIMTPCEFWIFPGEIGVLLQHSLSNDKLKIILLIKDRPTVFCCDTEKFNFSWIIIG